MAQVQGTCDPRFAALQALLQANIDATDELGASLVVNIDGQNVVDIWGGFADSARTRPWQKDTIATVWSMTKNVTALAALVLIDRGQLSPHDKVATHWPEFAAAGKADIEVRHLLSHASGLSGWDRLLSSEEIHDVPMSTAMLAAQAPWWEPGTASGYHALTIGHLVGEVVRRVSGKSLGTFIREDLAAPLGADFQLGAREEDWQRVAEMVPPPPPAPAAASKAEGEADDGEGGAEKKKKKKEEEEEEEEEEEGKKQQLPHLPQLPPPSGPDSVAARTLRNISTISGTTGTPGWRRAELGAGNGHSNARGMTRLMSAITLGGTVDGVRLLSPKTIDLVFEQQTSGVDLVIGMPVRFGIGYGLPRKDSIAGWLPFGEDERVCFWGGSGGSVAIMDLERRVTVTYVMNKMERVIFGNDRAKAYVHEIYRVLRQQPA